MPKATFFNLPDEKRAAICRVAVEEFASHPYNKASINRIVKRAGIAKGSFYQYFESKKDLYLYILQQAGETKLAYLAPVMRNQEGHDFFRLLRELYAAGIRFAREHPLYAEIGRRLLEAKGTPIYREVMGTNVPIATGFFETLLEQAIARGELRQDLDVKMVAYLIAAMNALVVEYYTEYIAEDYGEHMLATVEQFVDMLQNGIAVLPERQAAPTETLSVSTS
ncbi:MAG: TetR/AcrR family transcriptional regulator [Caldilineae bacterium]|nr:MAG: TetR/AcrR family transcriptional regulator [Caldilineae bacterium]